jgi:hypothetical protein
MKNDEKDNYLDIEKKLFKLEQKLIQKNGEDINRKIDNLKITLKKELEKNLENTMSFNKFNIDIIFESFEYENDLLNYINLLLDKNHETNNILKSFYCKDKNEFIIKFYNFLKKTSFQKKFENTAKSYINSEFIIDFFNKNNEFKNIILAYQIHLKIYMKKLLAEKYFNDSKDKDLNKDARFLKDLLDEDNDNLNNKHDRNGNISVNI